MIEYTLRDINRNDTLHKNTFVLASDAQELLEKFIVAAIEAGASETKLMVVISGDKPDD